MFTDMSISADLNSSFSDFLTRTGVDLGQSFSLLVLQVCHLYCVAVWSTSGKDREVESRLENASIPNLIACSYGPFSHAVLLVMALWSGGKTWEVEIRLNCKPQVSQHSVRVLMALTLTAYSCDPLQKPGGKERGVESRLTVKTQAFQFPLYVLVALFRNVCVCVGGGGGDGDWREG